VAGIHKFQLRSVPYSYLAVHHQLAVNMAMPPSTANWHWKTKHVSPWAKEWFTSELAGVSTKDGNDTISVEKVTDVEGDVEIGQRKSKYAWIRWIIQSHETSIWLISLP
jgi:hypothetical protein